MAALAAAFAVTTDPLSSETISHMGAWTRDTTAGSECIYSSAFGPRNWRIIIAVRDAGTPTPSPTMVGSADTYTAANILIGLCVNASGAYAGWNQAAPFSGCSFAGYYRFAPSAAAVKLACIVSAKDLEIEYQTSTAVYHSHFGAILTAPTSPSGYAEGDGYRYGGMVSGASGDMGSGWRTNTAPNGTSLGWNYTTNGINHAGVYAVGGTTWIPISPLHAVSQTPDADQCLMDGTYHGAAGIAFTRSAAPRYTVGTWSGVVESPTGRTGQAVVSPPSTHVGVRISSGGDSVTEQAVVFRRTY